MPYKDKAKARAASAASMRKRYAADPEKFRKYCREKHRDAYNLNPATRKKRLKSNEKSRKNRRKHGTKASPEFIATCKAAYEKRMQKEREKAINSAQRLVRRASEKPDEYGIIKREAA